MAAWLEEPHLGARHGRQPLPRRVVRRLRPPRAPASALLRATRRHRQLGKDVISPAVDANGRLTLVQGGAETLGLSFVDLYI